MIRKEHPPVRSAVPDEALETLHDEIALLVWLFYVPAQVCLTMSYIHAVQKPFQEEVAES